MTPASLPSPQMSEKLTRDAHVLFLAHDVSFVLFNSSRDQAPRPSGCRAMGAEKFLAK